MQFLTDFADQAVVLPLALCVAAWLAWSGWAKGAWLWLAGVGVLLAAVAALKLVVLGCLAGSSALTSPSGHAAAAVFVYGGMAVLSARLRLGWALLCGVAIGATIGLTRVALHMHSVADVIVGGAVGLAILAGFTRASQPIASGLRPVRLLALCVPALVLLHGMHLDVEPRLRGAGRWLGLTICPATLPS